MVDKGHQHIALAAAAIDKSGQGIGIAQTAGFEVGTGIGLAAAQRAIGASDGQRGHKFRHHRRGPHALQHLPQACGGHLRSAA